MATMITPTSRTRSRRLRLSASVRRGLRMYDEHVECPKDIDAERGPHRVALLAEAAANISKALHLETQGRLGDPNATWQSVIDHEARLAGLVAQR